MKYSTAMDARFTSEDGSQQFFVMGCYGIGVGRLMAAIVEASHDDRGIIWPAAVAPFDAHLLSLRGGRDADAVVSALEARGLSVLFDDREDASAGEKFADSELMGIPVQVIVSERGVHGGTVEIRPRKNLQDAKTVGLSDVDAQLTLIRSLLHHA